VKSSEGSEGSEGSEKITPACKRKKNNFYVNSKRRQII